MLVPADALPLDVGRGLVLARTSSSDAADAFVVIDSERERLREWLPWVDATDSVEVVREFTDRVEETNAGGSSVHATIRLDETFCGFVGLRLAGVHDNAEIGYWLSAAAVGRGVMTRSVTALLDLGFGPLGLHRIELQAAVGNVRSRAVAERLGMTTEGVRREAERVAAGYVDLVVYSLLAPGLGCIDVIGHA